jgi:tRNA pseudouridine-54 N-methylase
VVLVTERDGGSSRIDVVAKTVEQASFISTKYWKTDFFSYCVEQLWQAVSNSGVSQTSKSRWVSEGSCKSMRNVSFTL